MPRWHSGFGLKTIGAASVSRAVGPWSQGKMRIWWTVLLLLMCGLLSCSRESTSTAPDRSGTYAVVITALDRDWKIRAIKTVREETGLGLAAAKELVEKLPATVKDGLTAGEAEALIRKLQASGMKAEARR